MLPSSNGVSSSHDDGQLIWRDPPDLVSSTLGGEEYLRYKYRLAMEQKRRRRPALTMDLFVDKSNDPEGFRSKENISNPHQGTFENNSRTHQFDKLDNKNWEPVMTRKTGQKPKNFHVERWLEEQRHIADKLNPDKLSSFHNTFERQMLQSDQHNSAFSRVKNYKNDMRLSWNGDLHVSAENKDFGTYPKLESVNVVNKRPIDRKDSDGMFQKQITSVNDQKIDRSDKYFCSIDTTEDKHARNGSFEKKKEALEHSELPISSIRILGKSPTDLQSQRNSTKTSDELSGYVYVKSIDTAVTQRAILPPADAVPERSIIDDKKPIANVQIQKKSICCQDNTKLGADVTDLNLITSKQQSISSTEVDKQVKKPLEKKAILRTASKSAGFKRASGALKQLISLHEGAIARVSGDTKNQTRNKLLRARHSVAGVTMRDKDIDDDNETRASRLLKRHTTIGLPSTPLHGNDSHNDEREPTPPPIPPKPKELFKMRSRSEDSAKESSVVIETHFISVSSAKDQFENLTAQSSQKELVGGTAKPAFPKSYSFAEGTQDSRKPVGVHQSCQTSENYYCSIINHAELESRIKLLIMEQEKNDQSHKQEIFEVKQKLDEQRKVANAYQKLEDRYRRQVNDLQQTMKLCTCGHGNALPQSYQNGHRSIERFSSLNSRNTVIGSIKGKKYEQPSTINKVDGILNELETWLNEQQTPLYSTMVASSTDGSSVQVNIPSHGGSVMSSLSDFTTITADRPEGSPLDIIDKFDATCV